VLPAIRHRQLGESARILSGAIAGARDQAIHDGALAGFRLIPDPQFPLTRLADGSIDLTQPMAAGRLVPIEELPTYTTGAVTIVPPALAVQATGTSPCLMVEEQLVSNGALNEPTAWFWNVRVGDKLQLNGAGLWYTVVGPMVVTPAQGNTELFVNVGAPGTQSPWNATQGGVAVNPEFLFLTNGLDDNADGWIDSGYDGVDNNGDGVIDNPDPIDQTGATKGEWEAEAWPATALTLSPGQPYTLRRRPGPSSTSRGIDLPTNVVIDLGRSRVPIDPYTGAVDILVGPTGAVTSQTRYGVPSSVGMGSAFLHLWLAERSDVGVATPAGEFAVVSVFSRTGRVVTTSNPPLANPFSAIQQGAQ
jgi:hypothetical protein